jgi:hypothetical protein
MENLTQVEPPHSATLSTFLIGVVVITLVVPCITAAQRPELKWKEYVWTTLILNTYAFWVLLVQEEETKG